MEILVNNQGTPIEVDGHSCLLKIMSILVEAPGGLIGLSMLSCAASLRSHHQWPVLPMFPTTRAPAPAPDFTQIGSIDGPYSLHACTPMAERSKPGIRAQVCTPVVESHETWGFACMYLRTPYPSGRGLSKPGTTRAHVPQWRRINPMKPGDLLSSLNHC